MDRLRRADRDSGRRGVGAVCEGDRAGDGLPAGAYLDRVFTAARGSFYRLVLSSARGAEATGDEPRAGGDPRE